MKKNILLTVLTAGLLVVLAGCSKEPLNNLTENGSRIYITNHDSTADFAAFTTFSIADSVAVINNNQLEKKALTGVDAAFINAVKMQMEQRGYTMVDKNSNPDLGITVSRVYNTYSGVVSYPDYWDYYNGYWDPYYWGYPGYSYYFPSYYGIYQVQEGALSVDMLDLKDASNNSGKEITGVWSGLIRGSGVFDANTAGQQVQALFDQSVYLHRSNP